MELDLDLYIKKINESSLLNWWPKVKHLDVPMPRTIIIEVSGEDIDYIIEHRRVPENLYKRVRSAADEVGYPAFLRTDQLSGKHEWNRTCFVEKPENLERNIVELVMMSIIMIMPSMPVKAFVVREFLELDWRFKAFSGLPIAPERRYIVSDGEILAHFPYWPTDAISFYGIQKPENWRELLEEVNAETGEEVSLLSGYASRIGRALGGFWSVDFAKSREGVWYFIDAARGEVSWMPREVAEDLRRKGYIIV